MIDHIMFKRNARKCIDLYMTVWIFSLITEPGKTQQSNKTMKANTRAMVHREMFKWKSTTLIFDLIISLYNVLTKCMCLCQFNGIHEQKVHA